MIQLEGDELNIILGQAISELQDLALADDWDLSQDPRQYRAIEILQRVASKLGLPPATEWLDLINALDRYQRLTGANGESHYERLANEVKLPGIDAL